MKITGHKMFRRYAMVTVEQQRDALPAPEVYRQHRSIVTHISRTKAKGAQNIERLTYCKIWLLR